AVMSVSLLRGWSEQVAMLRPFWTMAQLAALALGVYLLLKGRMPLAIEQWGRELYRSLQARFKGQAAASRWPAVRWWAPVLGGMGWAAFPDGLLCGVVLVAAQANTPAEGAFVMLAFALPSGLGVWFTPWLLARLARRATPPAAPVSKLAAGPVIWLSRGDAEPMADSGPSPADAPALPMNLETRWVDPAWALRLAGAMLIFMSVWAVRHRLWEQWLIWCA